MTRGRLICELVHMLALGIWLASIGVAGFAAARIFRTMSDLDPQLPGFAAFEGAHWSVAGGRAVLPLFFIVDVVQFAAVLVAGGAFAAATGLFGVSLRRLSTFTRAFLILALIAVLSYRFFVLQGPMMQNLVAYWQAAGAGETETALQFKGVFDRYHELDRRLMQATALLVLGAVLAAFWSALDTGVRSEPEPRSELEEPLLARR